MLITVHTLYRFYSQPKNTHNSSMYPYPNLTNISPSDGGDESSDTRVEGNMREMATPAPDPPDKLPVHQTHGGGVRSLLPW